MSVATKTKIALVANAEGIASVTGKLFTALPTDTSADPTVTRAGNTATRINSSGNIETVVANRGRISYRLGTNKCPNLLVERTEENLLQFTEDFSNAYWGKQSGANVVSNTVIAPDGTLTADTLNLVSGTSVSRLERASIPVLNNTYYTFSFFVQNIALTSGQTFQIRLEGTGFDVRGTVDLANKTNTVSVSGTVGTGYVSGSQRANLFEYNSLWSIITVSLQTGSAAAGNATVYLITNVDANRSFYIWGAKFAANSIYTSYIPRLTAAAVTRNADAITKTGISAIIPQTKGGLFFDGYLQAGSLSDALDRHAATITSAAFSEQITIARRDNALRLRQGASDNFITIPVPLLNKRIKVYIAYNSPTWDAYLNGNKVIANAAFTSFAFDRYGVGNRTNADFWDGLIKAVTVTDELDATGIDKLFQFSSYADMAAEMLYTTN
jgi:hypothetical protein